jgi:hypothetical protein
MNEREWLDSLKPGDRVIISGRWQEALATVDRVTKTQILVKSGSMRFRKKDGGLVGADSYNNACIYSPTERRVHDIMHRKACEQIGKVQWKTLTLETLHKVLETVN